MANERSLLALPGEIRNEIWRVALVEDKPIDMAGLKQRGLPELLETSVSVPPETLSIYYGENTFILKQDYHLFGHAAITSAATPLQAFALWQANGSSISTIHDYTAGSVLASIPASHLKLIRKMRLDLNPVMPAWWMQSDETVALQAMSALTDDESKVWLGEWKDESKKVLQHILNRGVSLHRLRFGGSDEGNTFRGLLQDTFKRAMQMAQEELMQEEAEKA